jgi:AraC-like DNA-binding protein
MENKTKLLIKGMVCNRCVMVVKDELESLGHRPLSVELGGVTLAQTGVDVDREMVKARLSPLGFDLLEDPKTTLVNDLKALVAKVYSGDYDFPDRFRFALLAEERLQKSYDSIRDAFVALEKQTIEQYIITYRINKVKEYLVYSGDTLADIAFRLNFNSVAHLSAQFKQQTGLTPSYFKEVKRKKTEVIFSMN